MPAKLKILPLLLVACLALLSTGFMPTDEAETPQPINPPDPLEEMTLLLELAESVEVTLLEVAETIELTHEQLLQKQELLQELGWYEGEVDGIKGPLTEEAIDLFADAADLDDTSQETLLEALEDPEAPEAPPPPPPPPPPTPTPAPPPESNTAESGNDSGIASHWLALADCESGEWDANANPIPGSRRWNYGAPGAFVRPGYYFHGGLNFAPSTWRWVAGDMGLLGQYPHAYDAPPEVQVQVGAEVQRRQGWGAWPVCSRKVGLR